MKQDVTHSTPSASFCRVSLLIILTLIVGAGCKKVFNEEIAYAKSEGSSLAPSDTLPPEISIFPEDELVVLVKPGTTEAEYNAWLEGVRSKGVVNEYKACGSCDNTLKLLKGQGIKTYIQGSTASGGVISTPVPSTGEDGPVYRGLNFKLSYNKPEVSNSMSVPPIPNVIYSGTTVKVAIFDTGVDPGSIYGFSYKSSDDPCINGAETGWNFVSRSNDFKDDNAQRHGTVVTRFVIDQATQYKKNRIEILPVKTHDANGVGDLFSLLCGFAYAQERGAQIINASCGYYLPRLETSPRYPIDPNSLLLREFVRKYLTKNKILLVVPAGNKDDVNEKKAFDDHKWEYPSDYRDLDQVHSLPASLTRDSTLQNVIAVTTIKRSDGSVSPYQNFSPKVVDIGVNLDAVVKGDHYIFNNPLLANDSTVEGSSFAAPIFTGKLAANYDLIKPYLSSESYTKTQLFDALGSSIVGTNPSLANKVKNGRFVAKLR